MKDVTGQNFGYLVAYVVPGLLLLLTANQVFPGGQPWLEGSAKSSGEVTVGGFLFITLASVAAGVTASTVRWLIMDWVHHRTGIVPPRWDDARLQERLGAFEALVDAHYRYYQFYANSLVSMLILLVHRVVTEPVEGRTVTLALLSGLFWLGSRDTLRRYYRRTERLLGACEKGTGHDKRTSSQEEPRVHPAASGEGRSVRNERRGEASGRRRGKRQRGAPSAAARGHEL